MFAVHSAGRMGMVVLLYVLESVTDNAVVMLVVAL